MLRLIDDGTLDTVYRCDECGEEERFSQDWRAGHLLHQQPCPAAKDYDAECTCYADVDYDSMDRAAAEEHDCEAGR